MAEICAACHGVEGISDQPGVPHLSGQHPSYIQAGLLSYKDGHRKGTRMAEVVVGLSKQDIANVAAYYGSLKPFNRIVKRTGALSPAEEDPFATVREATGECAACHGDDGNSDIPGMPSLAGQHVSYLITALKHYQDGVRKDEDMQAFLEGLTDADLEDMAYFYAAMEPKRAEPPTEGDALAGLAVTAPCSGCHADDGNNKDPKTPRLAGLDAEYLVAAAEGYRSGGRNHEVMREALASLRETDIKDMAAFYATSEPKALPVRKPLALAEWAEKCSHCHGAGGHSADPRFPILAGQNEAYLINALKRYHGGERESSMMYAMSFLMGESDIAKLAAFYAGQGAD
ncbi:MAG: c-type cytochrome [Proteobacteria bacterium]|nr:c-type cytochrome [Pseudomonadota bacterium]